jgi:dolichol-phosphate mannosyltransferase
VADNLGVADVASAPLDDGAGHKAMPAELSVVVPCFNERGNVDELVRRLAVALQGIAWEAVFVDDDSPDGTAEAVRAMAAVDSRVRCIRRIGRRGLSSAVIEGVLSCSSRYVAVIDGDLQHDETRLPDMLRLLRGGEAEVVVASRFAEGGDAEGLANARRLALSNTGIRLADFLLGRQLTDPMSGYFMMPRDLFERKAPRLTGQGFKILLDLLLSAPEARVREVGAHFRPRLSGESKLSPQVLVQFLAVLLDKLCAGLIPLRFFAFAAVGAFGVVVHLAVLTVLGGLGASFVSAQTMATLCAMGANFQLNNAITYRDQKLRGGRLWRGLILFMLVCGVGAFANIGIASAFYASGHAGRTPAGALGAVIGVVWNYAMSATLVWGRRARK